MGNDQSQGLRLLIAAPHNGHMLIEGKGITGQIPGVSNNMLILNGSHQAKAGTLPSGRRYSR